jgi:hypothetical protein
LIVHISQTQFIEPNLTFDIVSSFIVLTPTIRVRTNPKFDFLLYHFKRSPSPSELAGSLSGYNSIKEVFTHSKNLHLVNNANDKSISFSSGQTKSALRGTI